jgi:glucan endo-1,3-alpha-glucosidase
MIGGINDAHVLQDVADAKAMGLDAFAMNINTFESWATDTVDLLFKHADDLGFGLFFSFDMAGGYFSDPSEYADVLKSYLSRPSYFQYNGKALVSTFGGEDVPMASWSSFKESVGDVLVIPGFYQATPSDDFFSDKGSLDGVLNWNSWPNQAIGQAKVATDDDKKYMTAAKDASKIFLMGISPLQYKHMDATNNWYRRGESNLEVRLAQVLDMQPDMLEIQTWNDAGESHYVGNIWPEPAAGSPSIQAYTDGYNHTGYKEILGPFITAWKRGDTTTGGIVPNNGKDVQGTFWHHTLLVDGDCSADALGKPDGYENAEDAVSGVILVASGKTSLTAVVKSGETEMSKIALIEGYNAFKVDGLVAGKVSVEVFSNSTMVSGGYGSIEVANSASLCNYNFQVVPLGVDPTIQSYHASVARK